MTAAPEAGLTEREIIERAVALTPAPLARPVGTERLTRYFRDAATYWTHVGPGMYEPLVRRVGCDTLGLPSEHIALIP